MSDSKNQYEGDTSMNDSRNQVDTELIPVAVYGSLRKGLGNHGVLGGTELSETKEITGYRMYDYGHGAFPAVNISGNTGTIIVEVYHVTPEIMDALDSLEGYPYFYDRQQTELGEWIYFIKDDLEEMNYPRVDHGDWLRYKRELQYGDWLEYKRELQHG